MVDELKTCINCGKPLADRVEEEERTGTGVSRSMVEACNLRGEVLRLVHSSPNSAQDRFESLIESSINRARRLKLLPTPTHNYSFTTAVIGDSAAARQSALTLAGMGFEVLLFAPAQDSDEAPVNHGNIHRFTGATVSAINGSKGDFQISFQMGDQAAQTVQAGAVILGGRQAKKLTCIHQKELPGRTISSVMQKHGMTGISFLYPGATSVSGVYMADFPGPQVLVPYGGDESIISTAAALCVRYSDAPDDQEKLLGKELLPVLEDVEPAHGISFLSVLFLPQRQPETPLSDLCRLYYQRCGIP